MTRSDGRRALRFMLMMTSGSVVLGSSCISGIREQIVAGGLDFVSQSTTDSLTALFPIAEAIENALSPGE